MTRTSIRPGSGFTLVEIIIATSILGLALVAILQLFSLGISSTRRSQRSTIAVSIARNFMEEVMSRDVIDIGIEQGRLDDYDMEYLIEITEGDYEGLHEVDVAVMWSDAAKQKEYHLFCYLPEESQGFSVFPK